MRKAVREVWVILRSGMALFLGHSFLDSDGVERIGVDNRLDFDGSLDFVEVHHRSLITRINRKRLVSTEAYYRKHYRRHTLLCVRRLVVDERATFSSMLEDGSDHMVFYRLVPLRFSSRRIL